MNLRKDGYPQGPLVRAVWECCDELYEKLGRAPSRQEFNDEIGKREPHRIGISTHSRQWGEWMRHHNFSTFVASEPGIIPEEMHYPQYLRVWYAVTQLGSASAANIVKWIRNSNATLKETEIRIQLDALTVNSNSRYRYLGSRKSARTDQGNPYDVLFRTGNLRNTRYELYIQELHGIWDIGGDGKTPVQIAVPRTYDRLVLEVRDELFTESPEDEGDIRLKALREVIVREGQPVFRRKLIEAYDGRCAVTGCSIQVLLEAAHITPYAGSWHTRAQHGLLLKTDIHTLFDRGLFWIDDELKIRISEQLTGTEYAELDGRYLRLPKDKKDWPLITHLQNHRQYWSDKYNEG
ncbi:HNH endonuclease [Enterobacter hormaechei]|uniref:HNH endonuclease n=2 Tax=Enterobacter hormaechei TaxID=158836 RepID=UPI003C7515B0